MIADTDIYHSAAMLIKEHGEEAWIEAISRYFDMKEQGDQTGMVIWSQIAHAIRKFTDLAVSGPLS